MTPAAHEIGTQPQFTVYDNQHGWIQKHAAIKTAIIFPMVSVPPLTHAHY